MRVCSICNRLEEVHSATGHEFKPLRVRVMRSTIAAHPLVQDFDVHVQLSVPEPGACIVDGSKIEMIPHYGPSADIVALVVAISQAAGDNNLTEAHLKSRLLGAIAKALETSV